MIKHSLQLTESKETQPIKKLKTGTTNEQNSSGTPSPALINSHMSASEIYKELSTVSLITILEDTKCKLNEANKTITEQNLVIKFLNAQIMLHEKVQEESNQQIAELTLNYNFPSYTPDQIIGSSPNQNSITTQQTASTSQIDLAIELFGTRTGIDTPDMLLPTLADSPIHATQINSRQALTPIYQQITSALLQSTVATNTVTAVPKATRKI